MLFSNRQIVLFTGDSITDCDRARPVGERDGLGNGYVAFVDAIMTVCRPDIPLRVLNTGIAGDRIKELEARWETDVLGIQPDWLSILIGINDVWRRNSRIFDPDPVTEEIYERTYRNLIESIRPKLAGLILMTPFYLEPNRNEPMRSMMDSYGEIVRKLANEYDAVLVDTQAAFDELMRHRTPQSLSPDRVHPQKPGHMALARAFLSAVGFEWKA